MGVGEEVWVHLHSLLQCAAQPAAAPDAAIMRGCEVGWACRRGSSRRLVAGAAAQVSR